MMSTGFQILWTATAERDLIGAMDYIAQDSPGNARDILRKIRKRVEALGDNPERGRVVPELQAQGIGLYRELIVEPWRIIYRVVERKVYILSLIDARRNVEDILLQRLIR